MGRDGTMGRGTRYVLPTPDLREIAAVMENFEATASRASTGTGSRREGAAFEGLAANLWDALGDHLVSLEGIDELRPYPRFRRFRSPAGRTLCLPSRRPVQAGHVEAGERMRAWLSCRFDVADLVGTYPGVAEAVQRYAPETGPYSGPNYPAMYGSRRTTFDDTILLEENGVLVEKMLLEYKTAKSSGGVAIDGNAHERLSFQALQYLEVATRYPSCSFVVFANGAFARYKNKYHVNFRIQADRLSVFSWFRMEHCCTQPEYGRVVGRLIDWIWSGARP